jgi:hypothetical protein
MTLPSPHSKPNGRAWMIGEQTGGPLAWQGGRREAP